MINMFCKVFLVVLLFQICQEEGYSQNEFTTLSDTLVIRTQKQKGTGLFLWGASQLEFRDSIKEFYNEVILPKDIEDIRRAQKTTNFSSDKKYCVDIIKGLKNGKKIFIVDENNNKDFTDDSVRVYRKMDWSATNNLIKCNFLIDNGNEVVKDSTWIKIGTSRDILLCSRNEHLLADLTIGKVHYQIGIIAPRSGDFTYRFDPDIALLSDNNIRKDTLLVKDVLKLGEFLNLNNNYYRLENISNTGEYVTLIKENNFENKIGTQVGMIAPEFTAVSITGDTIKSSILHNKIMIVANACGCGGDILSTEAYYDMKNAYGDKIHIIGLDSKIDKQREGLFVDVEEEQNKDIYNKFRQAYCSRTCFVIGENNRIIDKFEVVNWKSNLPKLLN